MKRLLMVAFLMATVLVLNIGTAWAGEHTYECYRYVKGKPTGGWIKVKASSKSEAERKALIRFKQLGGRVDYAKCNA